MFSFLFDWLEHVKLKGRALWNAIFKELNLPCKKNEAGRKIASVDFEEFSWQHLTRKVEITTFLVFTPDSSRKLLEVLVAPVSVL